MATSGVSDPKDQPTAWGHLAWAKWLPEVFNVTIVAIALLGALASLVSYPDQAIRESLVDTYEPSAWNFIAVCLFAVIGAILGFFTRSISRSRGRRRLASTQIALMVASVLVAAYGHHQLMRRTTELTGQSFGGFP